jgi:hypothetical protein
MEMACAVMLVTFLSFVYNPLENKEEAIMWGNRCLIQGFDFLIEEKLKKWDIRITPDLVLLVHKEYANRKREIYCVSLKHFKKVTHSGAVDAGVLQITTDADNITKQTFHDPKGDTDTMLVFLNLNVRHITPGQVDSLNRVLNFLKRQK